MSKERNVSGVIVLSALAFTMISLFAAEILAQKGPNSITGAPLHGVEIKLGRNPGGLGGAGELTGRTEKNGEVKFVDLTPGDYSLTIVGPSNQQQAANGGSVAAETYEVEIIGPVDGPRTYYWDTRMKKAYQPAKATAKTSAPHYTDSIDFHIKVPTPVFSTIIRSKSNITNN